MVTNSGDDGGQPAHDLREGLSTSSAFDRQVGRILTSVSWVIPLIIAVNVLVFVAMAVTFGAVGGFDPNQLAAWGGNSGTLDLSGQWWRLLTYQFLHMNLLHIAVNMWVLWSVGRLTERLYGSAALLFLYLAAGALAGLASIVWIPSQISVGASGSIFGILGAFLAFLLRSRDEVPSSVLRYWIPALLFVGYNLFAGAYQPGVDNAAHVGGLIAGFGLGIVLARPLDSRRPFALRQGLAAILLAGACALLPLWYLDAFHHRSSPLETFGTTHRWYMSAEGKNLLLWQTLAMQIGSGTISNDEAGKRFEQDILPFWKDADARLGSELKQPRDGDDPVLRHVSYFAKLRLVWAQVLIQAMRNGNAQNMQAAFADAQQTALAQAAIDRLKLRGEADNLPVPLSESAMAIWVRDRMPGLQWQCVDPPVGMERPLSPSDARNDGPALQHAAGCLAQRMFMAGDYAVLDATMARYARNLSDLPDGSSRFEGMSNGLDDLFSYGRISVLEALQRTSRWRRSVRGSVEPDLVEALIFRDWAYGARGRGYASSVSPQAMQLYIARSAMAEAGLYDVARSAANEPLWYVLSLGVDRDQSYPIPTQRALFDKGAARFPTYLPLYRQMLTSLMPRWGGSVQAVDSFIREVSARNGKIDPAMYARLYLIYGDLEGDDYNFAGNAGSDPALLKQGMEKLRSLYPGSDYIVNSVARFACIDNDVFFYREVRPLLYRHESTAAWPDKLSVASCNKWSN